MLPWPPSAPRPPSSTHGGVSEGGAGPSHNPRGRHSQYEEAVTRKDAASSEDEARPAPSRSRSRMFEWTRARPNVRGVTRPRCRTRSMPPAFLCLRPCFRLRTNQGRSDTPTNLSPGTPARREPACPQLPLPTAPLGAPVRHPGPSAVGRPGPSPHGSSLQRLLRQQAPRCPARAPVGTPGCRVARTRGRSHVGGGCEDGGVSDHVQGSRHTACSGSGGRHTLATARTHAPRTRESPHFIGLNCADGHT